MERFAFRINGALKQNLYQTCRLCGIDNPEMVNIIAESSIDDGDVKLTQKIEDCIGFTILKNDKMPQSACSLCVDKVNDFYEFREMCHTTNTQMRKLLGLKSEKLKKNISLNSNAAQSNTITIDKRGRKRQSLEAAQLVDPKLEVMSVMVDDRPDMKKLRLMKNCSKILLADGRIIDTSVNVKNLCIICNQSFSTQSQLKHHLNIIHVPNIPRYSCTSCNEAIDKAVDIKNHQLWHKASKTPYSCPLCKKSPSTNYAYSRHIRDHNIELALQQTVDDADCGQCGVRFVTRFLFNTHDCAFRLGKCVGCKRPFKTKTDHMRHAATCVPIFGEYAKELQVNPVKKESGLPPDNNNESISVINEAMEDDSICDLRKKKKNGKKNSLDSDLKRVGDLLNATMDALVSIKHEPEVNVEVDGITIAANTNANETSDCLENQIRVKDQNERTLAIKQEILDEGIETEQVNQNIELNIKKELISCADEDPRDHTGNKIPLPRIKIKKEHGTLNSSLVEENSYTEGAWKKQCTSSGETEMPQHNVPTIRIKQEVVDEGEIRSDAGFNHNQVKMVGPMMTSIPLAQIQISCVSGGVNFMDSSEIYDRDAEALDVKPNVGELDRMMRLSQFSSEAGATTESEKLNSANNRAFNPHFHKISIKSEPTNRGYCDEVPQESTEKCARAKKSFFSGEVRNPAYGRIKIKQEKDTIDDCSSTLTANVNVAVECMTTIKEEQHSESENNANETSANVIDQPAGQDAEYMPQEQSLSITEKLESLGEVFSCEQPANTGATVGTSDEFEIPVKASNQETLKDPETKCGEQEDGPAEVNISIGMAVESIQEIISVQKELTSTAPPTAEDDPKCMETIRIETESASTLNSTLQREMSEEEQNILNHEVAAQVSTEPCSTLFAQEHDSCSSSVPDLVAASDCKANVETTDNLANESVDAALEEHRRSAICDLTDVMDNTNMNEIAENHNNANIERELLEELPQLPHDVPSVAGDTARQDESLERAI